MHIEEHVPLAQFSTMGVGGPARFFARAKSVDEVCEVLEFAKEKKLPVWILGGGSNTIFRDEGFPGVVIKIEIRGIELKEESGEILLTAGAGEEWDDVVRMVVQKNFSGVECLSGIPGSVGATPMQNVGAYGQEVATTIVSVRGLDRTTLQEKDFTNAECGFGYRMSRFKGNDAGRYVILSVTYRFSNNPYVKVTYPDLLRYAEARGLKPDAMPIADARAAVLAVRKQKAMLRDPNDPDTKSCGSFFMNAFVTPEKFAALQKEHPDIRSFPAGDLVKISAAWLIERAKFIKGYTAKGVGISTKHALAIVHRGGGAKDVLALADTIQQAVQKQFGILLDREPTIADTYDVGT